MKSNAKNLQIIPGKPQVEILLLMASDLVSFGIAFGFVTFFRYLLFPDLKGAIFDPQVIRTIEYMIIFSFAMLASRGLYPGWGRSSVVELKQIVEAITLAYVLISVIIFVQGTLIDFSRSVFILSWFFIVLILPISRFLIRKLIALSPWWGEPVVIIGLENEIIEVASRLAGCTRLGLRPVAGLAVNSITQSVINQFSIFPWSLEAQKNIQNTGIQTNILAISTNELQRDYPLVFRHLELSFRKTVFILDKDIYSIMMAQPVDIAGQPAIISRQSLLDPTNRLVKQITELLLSIVIFIPILIIGGFIALLIKIDSPGPIFYTQERIGLNRKSFKLFKFRTMMVDADEKLIQLLNDPVTRQKWETHHKLSDDPRITRVGKWVRQFSLDELPQFINILHGEMSLIGPRPLVTAEIDDIGEAATTILQIHPGLTGWWQVMGRNNLSFEERTRLDLYYVLNWSLWLDLFIFMKTFWVVLFQ